MSSRVRLICSSAYAYLSGVVCDINHLIRYSETINLLYHNIFNFDSLDTVVSLSQTVLKTRLNRIRKICLQYEFPLYYYPVSERLDGELELTHSPTHVPPYDGETCIHTCRVLAGIQGLQELYIHLGGYLVSELGARRNALYMLRPLFQIQQPRIFELWVSWKGDPAKIYPVEGAPFRIVPDRTPGSGDC